MLTAAEREEQIRMYNQQKQRLLDAGEERKNFMQQMERQRKQNEKLSEIEQVEPLYIIIVIYSSDYFSQFCLEPV